MKPHVHVLVSSRLVIKLLGYNIKQLLAESQTDIILV